MKSGKCLDVVLLTVYYHLCMGLVILSLDAAGATFEAYLDAGSIVVDICVACDLELSGLIEGVHLVLKAKRGPVARSFLWWSEFGLLVPFTSRQNRGSRWPFVLLCIHECTLINPTTPLKWLPWILICLANINTVCWELLRPS